MRPPFAIAFVLAASFVHAHAHEHSVPRSRALMDRHAHKRQDALLGQLVGAKSEAEQESSTRAASSTSSARQSSASPSPTPTPSPSSSHTVSSAAPSLTSSEADSQVSESASPSASATSAPSASSSLVSSAIASSESTPSSSSIAVSSPSSSAPSSTQSGSELVSTSLSISTNDQGEAQTITQVLTIPYSEAAPSSASPTASAGSDGSNGVKKDNDPGLSTGAIVGISVGVGVLVLAFCGFAIWRARRRRDEDENEAIRWPELNKHGDSEAHHPLPARPTGGHGFETNALEAKPHMLGDEDDYSYPPIATAQPSMGYYDHPDSDTEDVDRQKPEQLEMAQYPSAADARPLAGLPPRDW